MHLGNQRVYSLPDNYEVVDSSLDDIVSALNPSYSLPDIKMLSHTTTLARDVHGVNYLPGFVGTNNLKCTDYINVVVHALAHVQPLRDFFLQPSNYASSKSPLVAKVGRGCWLFLQMSILA